MLDRDLLRRVRKHKQSGVLQSAGSFRYVVFVGQVSMRAIVRTGDELFTATVARRAGAFDVVVNGNYFDATNDGKFDALWGNDSVPASETLIEGRVVRAGAATLGDARPRGFHLAEVELMTVGLGFVARRS